MPPHRITAESNRVDVGLVRQQYPIVDVVGRYGFELRRSGAAFIGRCPFHLDRGRPNLTVYPRSGRWVCFRCGASATLSTSSSSLNISHFWRLSPTSASRRQRDPLVQLVDWHRVGRRAHGRWSNPRRMSWPRHSICTETGYFTRARRSRIWRAAGLDATSSSTNTLAIARVTNSFPTLSGAACQFLLPAGLAY